MNGSDTTLIIIVVVSVLGGPILGYFLYKMIIYIHQQYKRKRVIVPPLEDRKAAFSVGGNLVREVNNVPITDVYQVSKTLLGRGSSAEVIIGEHMKNRRRYAIKIIDNTRKEVMWRYDREKNFLRDIDHTNVVRLYEVYTYKQSMFFVMELCTGGHLGQALQHVPKNAFPEEKARNYVLQILRALVHCHERGICHRDIKLQNILMENHSADAQVKVIDFGNAVRYRGQTPLTKVVGTTYTAAPEVFRKHYDERCDVWSLGVVTYILLSGRRPFERVEIAQNVKSKESSVIASILMGRYHFRHEIWQTISTDAISFVRACLEMHYQRRAYPVELLNHPWIAKNRESNTSLASYSAFAKNTMTNLSSSLSARGMGRGNLSVSNASLVGMESQLSSPHLAANFVAANTDSMKGAGCVLGSATSGNDMNSGNNSEKVSSMMNSDFVLNATPSSIQQPFHSSIRQTSMLAVAFAMPISRARQLRDLFQQIDNNNNGTIDQDEFRIAFQQFHPEMTLADIDLLFNVIDQDDNKAISFLEFVAATIDPREVDIREINQAFRILDKDQKGYLTKQDLLRVLATVPPEAQGEGQQYQHLGNGSANNSTGPQRNSSISHHSRSSAGGGSCGGGGGNSVHSVSSTGEESSNKALQEAIRLQRIHEKVDHILTVADMNRDGVISYTEFIFSMAEGSMSLFEGIDVNPEKLAQAPPVVQRPSFISRTMGIGSRSSLEEAQSLMRQLSSKRFNDINNSRRPLNPAPSIQELPRQQESSSFLSSILPSSGIMQGWFGGSTSGPGSSSVSPSGRHIKYREGYMQPQDPSVLMNRRDLQPADSIEDSSLNDMEQGQGQGQGAAQGASQSATQGQRSPSEQRERNSATVAPDHLTASYSNERDLSPVIPIYASEGGFGQKENQDHEIHEVVPNVVVSKYANADVIVDEDGVELIQTVLPKPTSTATRTRLLGTSIASIVPIDSMQSIEGILHNEDVSVPKPSQESLSKPNLLPSVDLEETNETNLANANSNNNTAKKFLQKQGTFANICIEEEEDWMRVGVAEPANSPINANVIPILQFDAMNTLRRNSNVLTQTTATTNDNSSRASSSRTTSIVRQFHHPMNANSAVDVSGSEYGADNSEGSISSVVHLTGQFHSTNASNTENNDDLEYDRRQSLASSTGVSLGTLTSATLGLLGRRAPSTGTSLLSLLHGHHGSSGASMLDAVPEGPADGSRSMLEEQSSLLSNDPRLRHLLVTQDIES